MSRYTGVDPEIRSFLEQLQADWQQYPALSSLNAVEARAIAEKVRAPWAAGGPRMVKTTEKTIDTDNGPVRIRVHYPTKEPGLAPALVYLHGGGFVMFSLDTHDRLMREYAARGGFVVIGVDYPLAPEAKYPVALHRIAGLMRWLQKRGNELSVDCKCLAIGGDSAGGNLAMATCLKLRDDDGMIPVALLCNYPGFGETCSDTAEAKFGGDGAILNRAEVAYYFDQYVSRRDELRDPFVVPLNADLSGLPPTFLAVPELDVLSEQSVQMHEALGEAGVMSVLKIYSGATHSFLEAMSVSALAREAIADGADWVARHARQGKAVA